MKGWFRLRQALPVLVFGVLPGVMIGLGIAYAAGRSYFSNDSRYDCQGQIRAICPGKR